MPATHAPSLGYKKAPPPQPSSLHTTPLLPPPQTTTESAEAFPWLLLAGEKPRRSHREDDEQGRARPRRSRPPFSVPFCSSAVLMPASRRPGPPETAAIVVVRERLRRRTSRAKLPRTGKKPPSRPGRPQPAAAPPAIAGEPLLPLGESLAPSLRVPVRPLASLRGVVRTTASSRSSRSWGGLHGHLATLAHAAWPTRAPLSLFLFFSSATWQFLLGRPTFQICAAQSFPPISISLKFC
jgi:hypothetical protein